ncbi:hypothetical protein HID58_018345, partial [Brassica napus]
RNGKRRNGSRNGGEEEEGGKIEVWRKGSRNRERETERDRGREGRRERVGGSITHKRSDCLDTDDMSTININSKDTVGKGKEITSSGGGGRKENNRDGGNNGGKGDGGEEENIFYLPIALLLFSYAKLLSTSASLTPDLCDPDERVLLLKLKAEFKIWKSGEFNDYFGDSVTIYDDTVVNVKSYPKTKSWGNSTECCSWKGVTCHTKSGKVIGLDLSCSYLYGRLEPNSSLFRLIHLKTLNLACNNFTFSPIPHKFNNLMLLETLNLSGSSLKGPIPTEILQLTNLVSLDLSSFSYISYLLPPPSWLFIENPPYFLHLLASNLKNLRALDMSFVNISSKIPHEFSKMQSLRWLHLQNCYLDGEFPSSIFLIPNLQSIILSHNPNLRGKLPVFRRNNSMKVMEFFMTSFSSVIPDSIGNLKHLALSLTGEIPSSIGNLKQLITFEVANNHLTGNIPSAIFNLTKLLRLSLDSNHFIGSLSPNIGQLSELVAVVAHDNLFTGAVPSSLFQISSLEEIDLENNQLSDLVGFENFSLLSNLEYLYLGSNNFRDNSPVDLNVFSSLKKLVRLDLSGIPLSTSNITSDSDFSSNFEFLFLSSCNITEFPDFIRDQRNLMSIYLSNNNIKGQVPDWLWRLQELRYLDLHNNGLIGRVSMAMERVLTIYTIIDFSGNRIHGQVPESIGLLQGLYVLNLSRNAFTGHIPSSLANLTALESLDLSQNKLSGEIPPQLGDLSSLEWINVSHNQLVGSIPQGTQFQRQNCSSYEGNPGLYGPSLKPVCGDPTSPETEPPVPEEEDEDEEVERLSWVAAGFGFAPGIIIGAPEKSADTLGPKEESDTADVASPLKARYEGKEGAKSRMEKESLAVMIVE